MTRAYLDCTIQTTRQLRVPAYGTRISLNEVEQLVRDSGSHFFDRDTMRFFQSIAYAGVYPGQDGWYFITSEKGPDHRRLYTLRRLSYRWEHGQPIDVLIDEVGGFQAHKTMKAARAAQYAIAPYQAEPVEASA